MRIWYERKLFIASLSFTWALSEMVSKHNPLSSQFCKTILLPLISIRSIPILDPTNSYELQISNHPTFLCTQKSPTATHKTLRLTFSNWIFQKIYSHHRQNKWRFNVYITCPHTYEVYRCLSLRVICSITLFVQINTTVNMLIIYCLSNILASSIKWQITYTMPINFHTHRFLLPVFDMLRVQECFRFKDNWCDICCRAECYFKV